MVRAVPDEPDLSAISNEDMVSLFCQLQHTTDVISDTSYRLAQVLLSANIAARALGNLECLFLRAPENPHNVSLSIPPSSCLSSSLPLTDLTLTGSLSSDTSTSPRPSPPSRISTSAKALIRFRPLSTTTSADSRSNFSLSETRFASTMTAWPPSSLVLRAIPTLLAVMLNLDNSARMGTCFALDSGTVQPCEDEDTGEFALPNDWVLPCWYDDSLASGDSSTQYDLQRIQVLGKAAGTKVQGNAYLALLVERTYEFKWISIEGYTQAVEQGVEIKATSDMDRWYQERREREQE
ncbi:hypothetical protein JCM11641_001010 [Rhodosporidiobolus odoratus]